MGCSTSGHTGAWGAPGYVFWNPTTSGHTATGAYRCRQDHNEGPPPNVYCLVNKNLLSGGGGGGCRECVDILASYNAAGCCGGGVEPCSNDAAEYKACDCCNS